MNENNMPLTHEAFVLTSVSESSNTNDIIDLTEIGDECEVTSVIVYADSLSRQQPGNKPLKLRRRKYSSEDNHSSKAQPGSPDDSICILYENIQPNPEVVVVNEVIIDSNEQNESPDYNSLSVPIPPLIMGSYIEAPNPGQTTPFFPEISSESTGISSQPINYSLNVELRAPQPSIRSSCKYATINERSYPPLPIVGPHTVEFERSSQPTTEIPLNLKSVPHILPNHASEAEKVANVPKIQCGICLDGPDEIAASDRHFTSTNCGHVFCNTCIKTAIKSAAKCPKCRKKITSRSIHPLYL